MKGVIIAAERDTELALVLNQLRDNDEDSWNKIVSCIKRQLANDPFEISLSDRRKLPFSWIFQL